MLKPPVYYVYIAECADGTFYTGQTNNIFEREKEHNGAGRYSGAKYTQYRRPVKIVHIEPYQSRSFAMLREKELKSLTHEQKYRLINCLAIY